MSNRKVHRSNLRFQFIAIVPGTILHDLLTEYLKALFQSSQMFSYGYVHRCSHHPSELTESDGSKSGSSAHLLNLQ